MARGKLLVYLLRRDLRVSDNPVLHRLATSKDHGFTHLLPIYVFPAQQIEVSGFLKNGEVSPYPQALSEVGKFWRCGPHRGKFVAQCVWDVKDTLEKLNSGLIIRVGSPGDVLQHVISHFNDNLPTVSAVWMTQEQSYEEQQEEEAIASICSNNAIDFKLWVDEKYFIDDRDTGLDKPQDLPDVFTSYRKSQEPLRKRPRSALPQPEMSTLPPMPASTPPQADPFIMPDNLKDLESRLLVPLTNLLRIPPSFPEDAVSAHPFTGGESTGWDRLNHLIKSGAMSAYKDTRNGMVGADFSTKLSAYLALGCLSARQIHQELLSFEDGANPAYEMGDGYGKGENDGTRAVRFELLWRDYMRLCTHKFGRKLFRLSGFKQDDVYTKKPWKSANKSSAPIDQNPAPDRIITIIERFLEGTTGMGLIDASQRELFHTGYTSNRARQNVASFFAKHLGIDWRYGAEWYESMLIDYDVSSNWSNWQYVAGVGNDPRGDARIFNPVKQAFDYDKQGTYVRMWVPEVKNLEKSENVFQPWTASKADLEKAGLADNIMVTDPIKRIDFMVDKKPRGPRKHTTRNRGPRGGRHGGGGGGGSNGDQGGSHGGSLSAGQGKPNSNSHQNYQANGALVHDSYSGITHTNGSIVQGSHPNGNFTQQAYADSRWSYNGNGYNTNRGRSYNGSHRGGRNRGGGPGFSNRGNFGDVPFPYYPQAPTHASPSNIGPAA